MTFYRKIFIWFCLLAFAASCSTNAPKPDTPLETLQAYGAAYKRKDYTTMKLLLSEATLKMHQQAAKDQSVTLDDIVQREKLFLPDQKTAVFRNQKIDGDKATIEMKDAGENWNTVNFVKEGGIWKIDKQSFVDETIQQVDEDNQKLDELFNRNSQP